MELLCLKVFINCTTFQMEFVGLLVVSCSYIIKAGSLEEEMGIGQVGKRKHMDIDMTSGSSLNL